MKTVYEISNPGCGCRYLPKGEPVNTRFARKSAPRLPEVSEPELSRHYAELERECFGVCRGFYPLGSCTMKYNPKLHERLASLEGFSKIHPLQPEEDARGCLELMWRLEQSLCALTGASAFTLQPAAGAHGEFCGLLLIKAYHEARGDTGRVKIIVPDSSHGTNPASASMAGFQIVNVPSDEGGCVDLDALRAAVGDDTAGLMLTNPNTLGLFDPNIEQITAVVHGAGGLCYYDGANLNAIMGVARPMDMGFDAVHLNLHKTFSTPHGGGGPGSGPVGCVKELEKFLPGPRVRREGDAFRFETPEASIGRVRSFYGNFAVAVKAFAYILTLGREGIPEAARTAVLNANYLRRLLSEKFETVGKGFCMHEFVLSLQKLKDETGVSALDFAKALTDAGMHPPTMYFPLIVREALMPEPTETESKETLDAAAAEWLRLYELAHTDPQSLRDAPRKAVISRPDEVKAAREPRLREIFPDDTAKTQKT